MDYNAKMQSFRLAFIFPSGKQSQMNYRSRLALSNFCFRHQPIYSIVLIPEIESQLPETLKNYHFSLHSISHQSINPMLFKNANPVKEVNPNSTKASQKADEKENHKIFSATKRLLSKKQLATHA
ncbi:hypothetical protein J1N35_018151 [Gossypium stocksii]|uniref:Uncharacterized protein n=1 Tax=Gossypium stocksii TaxID=47602 RepID=A0A9D4A5W3_9ROSI|nr:hypothetical protein J1N35_018151 [Gossypium stocksii]